MANTYTLIASNTLTGTTASVTFDNIPSTYSDLVIKCSTRSNSGSTFGITYHTYNNDAIGATGYSHTRLTGSGAAASSANSTNYGAAYDADTTGSTNTANTFGNTEIYIPAYNSVIKHPASVFAAAEANSATAYINAVALLYNTSAAITKIVLTGDFSFLTGSSFFLYGISNS